MMQCISSNLHGFGSTHREICPKLKSLFISSMVNSHVFLHMETEVIATGEGTLAQLTFEGALTSMFTVVAGEFIGSCEFPTASLPAAVVGLLTSVCTKVSLEMGTLGVHFLAVIIRTGVDDWALLGPGSSTPAHCAAGSCERKQEFYQVHVMGTVLIKSISAILEALLNTFQSLLYNKILCFNR